MTGFRYKAFVSYSWADAAWGKWLHHAIETYRTPKALIGKETAAGAVPARLHPLFKDREEEAAGSSIGGAVEAALGASEFLIVICSPRSAQSEWVNREVAWFKTHRDPSKVLALIVDGEPGSAEAECFPRALTHLIAGDLSVTDSRADAPLAADARSSGDGKRRARLKLAAAMLGVGLDDLVNRDDRRRTLRARIITGASLALALVMSGMAWVAVQARNEADHQRSEADGLVEFMLTDLRAKLEPVGRLDALDVVGQRALKYYAGQRPGNLDADALGRRSRALHLVGEVRNIRGDSVGGLEAFRQAAATTAEQLARDPDNPQRIFDHAQSVFWVGYIAYERGEGKEAEARFRDYKRLADQLLMLDPKKPEWQMEVSYAESNLGTLLYDKGDYAGAEPAFTKALAMVDAVAAQEKRPPARQLEVGVAINWLGKARAGTGQIPTALALHQREVALYQQVLDSDPNNTQAKLQLAVAWQHVGQLELVKGGMEASVAAYGASLAAMKELRTKEPANTEWQETEVRAMLGQADSLIFHRDLRAAWALHQVAQNSVQGMTAADPSNTIWSVDLRNYVDIQATRLHLARGEAAAALSSAEGVLTRIEAGKYSGAQAAYNSADAGLLAGDALLKLGRKSDALRMWQAALARLPTGAPDLLFKAKRRQFLLLKRLGKAEQAAVLARELERQGDFHPAFRRER